MKIRKNDIVRVITGDDSEDPKTGEPRVGKVLSVDREKGLVLIEGVNYIWKHLRRSQQHPHGARIQKEAPVHVSNVQLICQSCSKPTRVTLKKLESGEKVRICKKCRQAVSPEV